MNQCSKFKGKFERTKVSLIEEFLSITPRFAKVGDPRHPFVDGRRSQSNRHGYYLLTVVY